MSKTFSDVRKAFETDQLYDVSDTELREYLKALASGVIFNDAIKHHVPVMTQVIGNVQLSRTLKKINTQNMWLGAFVVLLTILQVVLAFARC
ncbi:MAG TPA: hypothetical protein VEP30_11640 [Chthoniobacterales bacterium]|nr:hypothetical protein [Chthoniobacterales bacterium]